MGRFLLWSFNLNNFHHKKQEEKREMRVGRCDGRELEQAVAAKAATAQSRELTDSFRRYYAACTDVVVLPIVVVELADADLFTGAR